MKPAIECTGLKGARTLGDAKVASLMDFSWSDRDMACPKGKIAYSSFDDAKKACASLAKMNYERGRKALRETGVKPKREKVRAYICPECGNWHVGRGPKGNDANWATRKIRPTAGQT